LEPPKGSKRAELSPREAEITRLICQGHSSKLIATELYISKLTVDKHRANIFQKTGVRNVSELVRWALSMGIERLP